MRSRAWTSWRAAMWSDGSAGGGTRNDRLVAAVLAHPELVFELSPADLDLALRLLRRARLTGRIGHILQADGSLNRLDSVVADQLRGGLAFAESRQRAARWELDRVKWALAGQRDFPLVALKGCAYMLADLPNARGRMFADVDLLVPEDRLRDVEECLRMHRWTASELPAYDDRYYREWAHELPPLSHPERNVQVDVHHNVLMRTARLKPDPSLMLRDARPVAGTGYHVLSPIDMVLHAMTHLLYGGEMDDALRELVDVNLLLRHYAETESGFWDAFWPRALQLQLGRPAYYGLRYASRLLDTPVPKVVLNSSDAAAPPAAVRSTMDRLVPRTLFPQHPDEPSETASLARWLLFLRTHWIRMPPVMLATHLATKAGRRLVGRWSASAHSG